MKKIIPIPLQLNKKFFSAYIEVHSIFPPISKLRPKEKELLCELMYLHFFHKDLIPDVRKMVLESADTIKGIIELMNTTSDAVYNNLSILRKHGIIKNNTKTLLNDRWIIYPDNDNEITFKIPFKHEL